MLHATHVAHACRFANGVALSADESWVAVVETCSMRVHRQWLSGHKASQALQPFSRLCQCLCCMS